MSQTRQKDTTNSDLLDRLENPGKCRFCGERAVVPVKDRDMSENYSRGNPYRLYCVACWKHVRMTSEEDWESHPDKFVFPEGEDEDPVPVFNCPRCEEIVEGQPSKCPNCGMRYEW
jgi:DNA-directed RNA polymerase subunit RPC12/RpoP